MLSSHNVILPDGTQTAPGLPLVRNAPACRAAFRELNRVFGAGSEQVTVADLGSLA